MDDEVKARIEALEDAVELLRQQVGLLEDLVSWSGVRPVSPKTKLRPPSAPAPEKREMSAEAKQKFQAILDRFDINSYLKKKPDK